MPARSAPDTSRGMIIAGGDLDAGERGASLLARLLSRCCEQGRVLVLQLSTENDDAADIEAALLQAGANEVRVHTLASRGEASDAVLVDRLEHTDLLVIAPCAPLRLTSLIGGTALVRALRRRNADGMAVAAFGAVAAALSEHMLATGSEGLTPRSGGVSLAPGLGLSNRVLIDQGGQATDRLGRLLAALALNPFALGLGIDAGTAAHEKTVEALTFYLELIEVDWFAQEHIITSGESEGASGTHRKTPERVGGRLHWPLVI